MQNFTSIFQKWILRTQLALQTPTSPLERRLRLVSGVFGTFLALGTAAQAQAGGAVSSGTGCASSASTALQSFLGSAANFAIGIGGVGALLMLAVGALMIIFGHTPQRASMGMKVIKNAVIGLGVLVAGLLLKFIIVDAILGAAGPHTSSTVQSCLNSNGGI